MTSELFDILRLAIEILGVALFGMGIGVQPCCCTGASCPFCQNGTTPSELEVTLAGLSDVDCSECATLNDTYILSYIGQGPAGCCWSFTFASDICTFNTLVACISDPIALGHQLEVSLGHTGGSADVIVYLTSLGESTPSCQWSDLDVAVTDQSQTECDDDSSTCTVSAV